MKTLNLYTRRYLLITLLIVAALGLNVCAQNAYSQTGYKAVSGSQIKVSGTSTMHDWSMQASTFTCEGTFVLKNDLVQDVSSLSFILPVNNLKSKEDLMDSRAYKALNTEKYANITFKLTNATVVPQQKVIKATGNLTISGVTNSIALQIPYVLNADETITCKGSKAIKMSDFKVKAPSFMLGALKTGDDLTIDILLKFRKANLSTASN